MSRLGKLAVAVPEKVEINLQDNAVVVKGPKGELSTTITGDVTVSVDNGEIWVKPANDSQRARSMWGTVRSNISNLVIGVTEGFTKQLETNGVGYRSSVNGNVLSLSLGYSHEIKYFLPEGVSGEVDKGGVITLSGADKQKVGQVASEIRALRKPEPYKGKGVKYVGEYIRRKEGKKK